MADIIHATEHMTALDQTTIFIRHWRPQHTTSKPKAIFQIAHGLAEHSARYHDFAVFLAKQGFIIFAHDHRGHGMTAQAPEDLGHFGEQNGWRNVADDLKQVNDHIRDQFNDTPIILLGHSMGSFIVQTALLKYPALANGVILSGSTVPNVFLVNAALTLAQLDQRKKGTTGRCRIVDYLTFEPYNLPFRPNRTKADWLTRDEAIVDAYITDPKCGFVATTQLWIDLTEGLKHLYKKNSHSNLPTDIPYLLMAGDKDPVGSSGKGVIKLNNRLKSYQARVEMKLYNQGRHEMLNEINRQEVYQDILAWTNRRALI